MATPITHIPAVNLTSLLTSANLGAREMMRQLRFMLESRDRRGRAAAVSSAQELRGRSSCCRARGMQTRRSQPDFKAVPLRNTIRVPPSTTGYCSPRPPPFHRLAQSVPLVMTAATGGGTRADDRMQLKEERDTGCGSCQAPVALATLRGRFGRLLRERRPCLHWVPRPTSPTEGARRSPISSPPSFSSLSVHLSVLTFLARVPLA